MEENGDLKASQGFEWQGRPWKPLPFNGKNQRRHKCTHCGYDHYAENNVRKHFVSEHLLTIDRGGTRFRVLVFYRQRTKIFQCPDCAFESQAEAAMIDHCGKTHLPLANEPLVESIKEGPRTVSSSSNRVGPAPLSPRDLRVHDIVGEENFRRLTTSEIIRTQILKSRLREEFGPKAATATRVAIDRIRRNKNYPLSRAITKKRSLQQ